MSDGYAHLHPPMLEDPKVVTHSISTFLRVCLKIWYPEPQEIVMDYHHFPHKYVYIYNYIYTYAKSLGALIKIVAIAGWSFPLSYGNFIGT